MSGPAPEPPASSVPSWLQAQWTAPGGPWDCDDLGTSLVAAVTGWPADRPVLVDDRGPLTADQLQGRVSDVVAELATRGVASGDVVVIHAGTSAMHVAALHATWWMGAVAAPVHHRLDAAVVQRFATRVGARHVLTDDELTDLEHGTRTAAGARPAPPASDAAAVLMLTGGTSGEPKAAIHTHRSIGPKAALLPSVHGLTADDVVLMPAPLGHMSGLLNGVLVPALAGMTTVLMSRWSASRALQLIEEHGVTFMVGPPTFFLDIMSAPELEPDRVASLRLISSGGAGISPAFVRRARRLLGAEVKRTYGSTEAPTVTTSRPGDDEDRAAATDGRPTPHTEIRIVDDRGAPVRAGPGHIQVRGPELFAGYVDTSEQPFDDDGWYRTGDLGALDDGWLVVSGRADDLIIRAGENVAPATVASALIQHPAITDAAVVGVADERLGQRIGAVVVTCATIPDDEELRRWLIASGLPPFAAPDEVVVVDAIPELDSGKPDRTALRAIFGR